MRYFTELSADLVWQKAASMLIATPDYEHSGRNGMTREILPCILRITDPRQRWILSRKPPYNPAFGLVEFIWIITGNNESHVLNYWNPSLPRYSGDGPVYHGAYGFRLRREFGFDQIKRAYDVLSTSPETRQAILQIWKPDIDMPRVDGKPNSQDIPCNVMSLLKVRENCLHWSQIMRSNDVMRGLPYNIIQFTMLQEVMAGWLNCDLGEYFHLSDSLHIYERDIGNYTIDSSKQNFTERDRFCLSYDETQELFSGIYTDLALVATGSFDKQKLQSVFSRDSEKNKDSCELIKDVLVVIGSDAARRHCFTDLANDLANSCSDEGLRKAALAWLEHKEG